MTYTTIERAERIYNGVVEGFITDKTSDVVTPFNLALEQVRQLPNREGNVLVPGAGIGTYILALLQEGFKPEQITAVELDPAYSRLGYGIFSRFGINYITADFTTWQPDMQFDVIIGNPPYQKSKYSDFYVCFFSKSAELLKEGGYFSMIAPAKGANPGARAQKPLRELGWNYVEFGVESYFPNIGTVIAHYSGLKGVKSGTVKVVVGGTNSLVPTGTAFPLTTQDPEAFSIVAKIFGQQEKMPFIRQKTAPSVPYVYVSRMVGTWHPNKPKGGAYALKTYINEDPELNDGGFLLAKSEADLERLQWIISRSLIMRFAVNQCGKAAFIPSLFWKHAPDITACETDEDIFTLLRFTSSEIDYIKKWESSIYCQ